MKIFFNSEIYKGQPIEVAKVVSDTPSELSGQFNLKQEFSDTTRTDMFYVVRKIRSATNGENYFDWYEIVNHIRFDDRFIPDKQTELEEDSAGILDLADLSDENSGAIIDIGEAIESLDERVAALEGGN